MGNIKDEAKAYVPPQTHNIAELEKIPVNLELMDGEGKDREGNSFVYKYILVDDKEYRIPGKVLGDLKAILEKKPDLEFFSVAKSGEGLATKYTVIPL